MRWEHEIYKWSGQYDLDPNLIATVMQIESCGHPMISSKAGALGLFQVMPYHFGTEEDPLDPETNARRGLTYLARALDLSGGRLDLALAGYNGGHSVIEQDLYLWPYETRRYVYWGTGILDDIQKGLEISQRLEEWFSAGGTSLCRRAAEYFELLK